MCVRLFVTFEQLLVEMAVQRGNWVHHNILLKMIGLALLALLARPDVATDAAAVPLTMLSDPLARCLDGTQAGFYVQQAPNASDARKWVIYLEGGGECDTENACKYQTSSSLGSSKYLPATSDSSSWFLASDYCYNNPVLCGWNHVRDPYCTQDLHAGQVSQATNKTWGLYFAGRHVFTAILDALDQPPYELGKASEIILHGASAGGIGVWMNVDYVKQRYPEARVTAATIAGHYFYATYYAGENHTAPSGMGDFRESAMPTTYDLYEAYVDQSCREAYEARGESPGACLLSNNSLPFIEVDSFIVQAQTDNTVLTGHDCWPDAYKYMEPEYAFMQEWAANMSVATKPFMQVGGSSPRRGAFSAACYTHTGFSHSKPLIQGVNFYEAFARFYFDKDTPEDDPAAYKLQDDCGVMCNPTC